MVEGPTVEPEEGLLRRDQAVDYPRSIIDAVSIFGIGWVCVVWTSVYAGTVDSHLRAWPSVQVVRADSSDRGGLSGGDGRSSWIRRVECWTIAIADMFPAKGQTIYDEKLAH